MSVVCSFIFMLAVSDVWDIFGLCGNKSVSVFSFSMYLSGIVSFCFVFSKRQISDLPVRAEQTAL